MKSFQCGVVLLSALLCATVQANDLGYSVDNDRNLWRLDFTAGTASLIGNTQVLYESIALRADGTLFAATNFGDLYTIHTGTAASTFIGVTGLGNIEALDFNGGSLVGMNFFDPPSAYSINQSTATPTLLALSNTATGLVRSGTVLDPTSMLIRGDAGGHTLYKMSLTTGATTLVGSMGVGIYGMDFVGPKLYGVGEFGTLWSINPLTGAPTFIADTGNQLFLSLATLPVPEPGSAALFATGAIALIAAAARCRRRCAA